MTMRGVLANMTRYDLMAIVGGCAFLFMVKLLYDMTGHMERMTGLIAGMAGDMNRMSVHIDHLAGDVSAMRESMQGLQADMAGMRQSVETMAKVVRSGGEQIERMNPTDLLQQMMSPGRRP